MIRASWEIFKLLFIITWRVLNEWADSLAERMEIWASNYRERTGQAPDWKLEHKIAKRRAKK